MERAGETSDIDGQTREGEHTGKKANQAVTSTGSPKGEYRRLGGDGMDGGLGLRQREERVAVTKWE